MSLFDVSNRDLRRLRKFYKKAPRQFRKTAALTLNEFAFGARQYAIRTIGQQMTVRDSRFVRSSFAVDKASPGVLVSLMGSIERDNFSGWKEQEFGSASEKGRTAFLLSRGGSIGSKVKQRNRLRPGRDFKSSDDYEGVSDSHRTVVMLQILGREKYKQPFIVKKHKKLKSGLYKFHRRKLLMLQSFEKQEVRRKPWMRPSIDRYFQVNPPREAWAKSIRKIIKLR